MNKCSREKLKLNMTPIVLKLLASLITLDFTVSQWTNDGTSQTYTTTNTTSTANATFQFNWLHQNQNNKNVTVFQCSTFSMKCDSGEDIFKALYSANITFNSMSYTSMFTIKKVNLTMHNTQWFCKVDAHENFNATYKFELKVFAIPESPTCSEVKPLNHSHYQIQCVTEKVFPESICEFSFKCNNSECKITQGHINYTHDPNLTSLYYKTTCSYVGSAALLGPGTHKSNVVMYANITSAIKDEMKRTSDYTKPFYIGYPKARLKQDCVGHGYIKENETRNCTCYDDSTSILPPSIQWINKTIAYGNGTITFTAKRNTSFKCIISNYFNWTDTLTFQPNISYPPDTLLVITTNQTLDLCRDKHIVISGSCLIGESNPEPTTTVTINNSKEDITRLKQNNTLLFNKTVETTGTYYITCLASSPEYLAKASSITAFVYGPPDTPKIIKNGNEETTEPDNLLEVTKGDILTCQAKGGYPTTKNYTLACGPVQINATNQDQLSMTWNISSITQGTCLCVVSHHSRCLHNTSTTVNFKIRDLKTSQQTVRNFENIYIGVGVAAAGVLVTICIIVMISQYRLHYLATISSGTSEKIEYNNDLYYIKKENSSIDISIYPEYKNVVTTMASAAEAPKNLKK